METKDKFNHDITGNIIFPNQQRNKEMGKHIHTHKYKITGINVNISIIIVNINDLNFTTKRNLLADCI